MTWNSDHLKKIARLLDETLSEDHSLRSITKSNASITAILPPLSRSFWLGPKHNLPQFIKGLYSTHFENYQDDLLKRCKHINFDTFLQKDLALAEQGVSPLIMTFLSPDIMHEPQYFLNKAQLLFYIQQRKPNQSQITSKSLLNMLFHGYSLHVIMDQGLFTSNLVMIDVDVFWDFPDLPRDLFYYILRDNNENTRASKVQRNSLKEKFIDLNSRTDLLRLFEPQEILQSLNISVYKGVTLDLIDFFDHYVSKVRCSFEQLRLDYDINLNDSKVKQFYSEIIKFRENNKELLEQTEIFFKKLMEPLPLGFQCSDDEKLCFCINLYNLKVLHQLLFHESTFPKEYCQWRILVDKTRFAVFGYQEMPIFWLDQAVIRQFLYSQQLFYILQPPTSLFKITQHKLDRLRFPFFSREKKREDEILLNFAISLHLKDTPNFRVYKNLNKDLGENASVFFDDLREIYKVASSHNSLEVVLPEEMYMIVRQNARNERDFLQKYYDPNLAGKPIQMSLKKIRWNMMSFAPIMKNPVIN